MKNSKLIRLIPLSLGLVFIASQAFAAGSQFVVPGIAKTTGVLPNASPQPTSIMTAKATSP